MTAETYDRVTWWELPVPDLVKAKEFYGAVFGWTFQSFGGGYEMASKDGVMVGALDGTRDQPPGHGVSVYFNVADIEETLARIASAGGEVLHERAEVGEDMGWWATFRDPAGLWLGLCCDQPPRDG